MTTSKEDCERHDNGSRSELTDDEAIVLATLHGMQFCKDVSACGGYAQHGLFYLNTTNKLYFNEVHKNTTKRGAVGFHTLPELARAYCEHSKLELDT